MMTDTALLRGPTAQMAALTDCRGDPVPAWWWAAVVDVAALRSSRLDGAALVSPVA